VKIAETFMLSSLICVSQLLIGGDSADHFAIRLLANSRYAQML
jgi:hypothetical protein